MSELTEDQVAELMRAFELTQDSGVVDQYGAKKMLQIFNMNPTTEDVIKRYREHQKDGNSGLTFEEFQTVFHDFLVQKHTVPDTLSKTLSELFEGPVSKSELRKILTEMGSEPFEQEEADDVINSIPFDENQCITQEELKKFLLNKVDMGLLSPKTVTPKNQSPTDQEAQLKNQSKQQAPSTLEVPEADRLASPEPVKTDRLLSPEPVNADTELPKVKVDTPVGSDSPETLVANIPPGSPQEVEDVITSDDEF